MSRHASAPRVMVIAEVGSVHDGSFGNAMRLVHLAADLGADVVKFQTHIAAAETLRDAPTPVFFKGEPRYEYFERTGFSDGQWIALREEADRVGIEFSSSPFSEEAVDLLERVGVRRYKIPSGEVTNAPLLERIGRTGKPVLLSSGMSTWAELDAAVALMREHVEDLTVLQCTTEYPCRDEHVGLNVLAEMRERYGVAVGLSDHTLTAFAALAAVTLGATVIEKHLAFSRRMYGSDASHSMEPEEFRFMVSGIRSIERMTAAPVQKDSLEGIAMMKPVFEKSVTSAVMIPAGTRISREMLRIRKPGTGIPAARLGEVIGRVASRAIAQDVVLQWADLQ